MASPKARQRRPASAQGGSVVTRAHVEGLVVGIAVGCLIARFAVYSRGRSFGGAAEPQGNQFRRVGRHDRSGAAPFLFIAIGSAPANSDLRQAARASWLRWLPEDGSVRYKFFSDQRPRSRTGDTSAPWDALEREARVAGDVVLQPLPTGYGSNWENVYGRRARFQLEWAMGEFGRVHYFLRIDDDSFLCLHRLLYELKSAPREQFFWGRYWCRAGRSRADENFMLFSGDVAHFLANPNLGRIVPFDESVTMGWNFGFLSWFLNLSIFDDQKRLDAQQGYLTDYMHTESVQNKRGIAEFCDEFIYAHHVHSAVIRAAFDGTTVRTMYPIPLQTSPRQTCPEADMSFIPARHSALLPNIHIASAT